MKIELIVRSRRHEMNLPIWNELSIRAEFHHEISYYSNDVDLIQLMETIVRDCMMPTTRNEIIRDWIHGEKSASTYFDIKNNLTEKIILNQPSSKESLNSTDFTEMIAKDSHREKSVFEQT